MTSLAATIHQDVCEQNLVAVQTHLAELEGQWADEVGLISICKGTVQYISGEYGEALAHYQLALQSFQDDTNLELIALCHTQLANTHDSIGQPALALAEHTKAIEFYRRAGNTVGIAVALMGLRDTYDILGEIDKAIQVATEALDYSIRTNSTLLIGRAHTGCGSSYISSKDFAQALEHYERALDAFTTVGNREFAARAYNGIGIVYFDISEYTKSLEFYLKAYETFEEIGSKQGVANVTTNIGTLYWSLNNQSEAISFLQKAVEICSELGDRGGVALAMASMGTMIMGSTDPEGGRATLMNGIEIFRELGCKQEAFAYTNNLIMNLLTTGNDELAKSILAGLDESDALESETHYANLAVIAERDEDLDLAKQYLDKALSLSIRTNNKNQEAAVHKRLRDLAQKQNDFAAYIKHNEAHQSVKEEIRGVQVTQRISALQAEQKIRSVRMESEKERALLYATLPKYIAERMVRGEKITGDLFDHAVILFSDITGFTERTATMHPSEVVGLLDSMYAAFETIGEHYGVTKIKTIGDSYMCFKADGTAEENAVSMAQTALDMQAATLRWPDNTEIAIRIGIHIGQATAGVIGSQRLQYDVWGDTVNLASRLEASSEPGRIHVSQSVAEALKQSSKSPPMNTAEETSSPFTLTLRGETALKGKGSLVTYWLDGSDNR